MKFLSVAVLAFAAVVSAAPAPEPAPGILGDISTFIDGATGKVSSFIDDVKSNVDEGKSKGEKVNSAIDEIFKSGGPSSVIASLTSVAGAKLSSLSSVAATATGEAASSLRNDISKLSESLASATSAAAKAGETKKDDAAPAPTAMVAMGALFGGAAILANM